MIVYALCFLLVKIVSCADFSPVNPQIYTLYSKKGKLLIEETYCMKIGLTGTKSSEKKTFQTNIHPSNEGKKTQLACRKIEAFMFISKIHIQQREKKKKLSQSKVISYKIQNLFSISMLFLLNSFISALTMVLLLRLL